MNMRILLTALLLAPLAALHAADAPTKKPNIVFIYSDDQPQRAMGSIDPFFSTPHIDRLAKESVVFDNAFVTTSICAVSRASFFTGQHSVRHRIASFDKPLSSAQMKQSYAGLLRQAGYRTAFLGKYAIGQPQAAPPELCLPEDQFDLWYGFPQALSYSQEIDGKKRYVTRVMEEKAVSFLRENPKDQPFLLIMALPEPHGQTGPWNYRDPDFKLDPPPGPPQRPKTMTQAALDRLPQAIRESRNDGVFEANEKGYEKYMATVRDYTARTDLAVGRVLQALQDLKIEDNTVVIFTSDNGSMWGAHGLTGKWNMYEESIRVPLMIRDPRLPISTRGNRPQMALNIDIAPTIVAMAGLPVPNEMQGIDLSPILRDPKVQGRADWYYEHEVRSGSQGKPLPRCEGVRSERWKYIRYKDTQPLQEELFDLRNDPLEEHNLAKEKTHAATLAEMSARCDELRKALR